MISGLRRGHSPGIRVAEVTFSEKENQIRMERIKAALNLEWVYSYRDDFYEDGGSLLEMEMKFLEERNGKVVKQDVGPVTTKDLFDSFSVVVSDLLHAALERYGGGNMATMLYGSTNVAAIKSGRDTERLDAMSSPAQLQHAEDRKARRAMNNRKALSGYRDNRHGYSPDRLSSIYARRP